MKRPTRRTRNLLTAGSICVLLAGVGQAESPAQPPLPRGPESSMTPTQKNPDRHQKFLERIKLENRVNLLFLGDSITDGWPRNGENSWLKFARYRPANFGIGGDRTEHLLWRIENGELEGIQPRVVVIMIGTNNLAVTPPDQAEWVAAGIQKIVETVQQRLPATKILLLAIFPRGGKNDPKRAQIAEINRRISKLGDGRNVRFLDLTRVFLKPDGTLPASLMPDGLHLSASGYNVWHTAMQPTLDLMMKN